MKAKPGTAGRLVLSAAIAGVTSLTAVPPPAEAETVLHSFAGGVDGAQPLGGVIARPDGRLIGTELHGGAKGEHSYGEVFLLLPPAAGQTVWAKKMIYKFKGGTDGFSPSGELTKGPSGVVYGTTLGSGATSPPFQAPGVVYQLAPPVTGHGAWTQTVLHHFVDSEGDGAEGGLAMDGSGNLYGALSIEGGTAGCGAIYQLSPPATAGGTWTETTIHTFTGGADGCQPQGDLLFDPTSFTLFGTTYAGGATASVGQVFQLSPPTPIQRVFGQKVWNKTVLYNFTGGSDGAHPNGGLVGGPGAVYGTAYGGGKTGCSGGCGTVFELNQQTAGSALYTLSLLHSFTGAIDSSGAADGSRPEAGLIQRSGRIWGTTSTGGGSDLGADCEGSEPDGNDIGCGTVFQLTLNRTIRFSFWQYAVLYRFFGLTDGSTPEAPVTVDLNGNAFGTTSAGGDSSAGAVFEIIP